MPNSSVQHPVATRYLALGAGTVALLVVIVASLAIGSRPVAPDVVVAALLGQDVPAGDRHAVVELRVPRTVIGCAVGIALGVAGALIQAVTRNPLADPGILGVTAGSSFFVALGIVFLGFSSPEQYVWLALAGRSSRRSRSRWSAAPAPRASTPSGSPWPASRSPPCSPASSPACASRSRARSTPC
ncbi:hypothetical protein FHX71_003291 [Promicromonospora sukumoe]|uniref:FecCD transport family protein n=1 Tax=Promicromonospora sukumoe TaxID=88382 RepID=A0A7W3JAS2_9MICO|nr:hypothetical protein [Promicromonospora sukumoe]